MISRNEAAELWYKGEKNTGVSQWMVAYNQTWGVRMSGSQLGDGVARRRHTAPDVTDEETCDGRDDA
jgi:hypothetical protein